MVVQLTAPLFPSTACMCVRIACAPAQKNHPVSKSPKSKPNSGSGPGAAEARAGAAAGMGASELSQARRRAREAAIAAPAGQARAAAAKVTVAAVEKLAESLREPHRVRGEIEAFYAALDDCLALCKPHEVLLMALRAEGCSMGVAEAEAEAEAEDSVGAGGDAAVRQPYHRPMAGGYVSPVQVLFDLTLTLALVPSRLPSPYPRVSTLPSP